MRKLLSVAGNELVNRRAVPAIANAGPENNFVEASAVDVPGFFYRDERYAMLTAFENRLNTPANRQRMAVDR